jgi:hypothetical protein
MKVDKDALLKQKFWILLGVFAVLWILSLSVLWATAGGPITEAKTKYDTAKGGVEKYPHPKNDSFLPPWEQHAETFKKHKNTVWEVAWNGDKLAEGKALAPGERLYEGQARIYTWPSSKDHPLDERILYPDKPFDVTDRGWYKAEGYKKQVDGLFWELKPDGNKNDPASPPAGPLGPVAMTGGDYYKVMNPVDFADPKFTKDPDAEECWIAQEDFWVKRELLYTVRDALKMAGRMDPADDAETKPLDAKFAGRHIFRNTNWEVQLLFVKTADGSFRISSESTIKNVHASHRDQDLGTNRSRGVWFRLEQAGAAPTLFAVEGERIPYGTARPFDKGTGRYKDGWATSANPAQSMAMEQVFDPTNSPITQIDDIKIPYLSHRNAIRPLIPAKPKRYGKEEAPVPDPSKVAASTNTASPPGAMPPSGGTSMGSMNGPPGVNGIASSQTGTSTNKTTNMSFDRNRYLFVTDQSRHLPVAMTLTVDQSHLHEILVAIANSRLRFQTTQVEFRRVPAAAPASSGTGVPGSPERPPFTGSGIPPGGSTPPMPLTAGVGSAAGPPGGVGSAAGPPGGVGSAAGPPGGFPSGAPAQPSGAPAPAVSDADNPNLIEVTIYGIASLYERPPAPTAAAK